jgi:DNA polymerase
MPGMSEAYERLLDATIQHLRELKGRGVRFVPVSAEALSGINSRPKRTEAPQGFNARAAAGAGTGPAAPGRPVAQPSPPTQQQAAGVGRVGESAARPAPMGVDQAKLLIDEVPATQVLSAEAKAAAFAELRQRALACVRCSHLASARRTVVFGVGSIDAELMFVGEAPGADEDQQGEPFVGKAGQLLTKIIQTMSLSRETVYIANILKCRPDTPGQSAGNRKPTPDEMKTCIPYLHEQIDLIRPKVLVALGATAVEGLLGKTAGITRLRGQWHTYRGIPLMPTYHPAYLLRNQALSEKRRVWEDMLQVMGKLGMTITGKQKGYFL